MGQTMLTIGAMVLLGLTIMSVNSNNLQNGVILRQTEIGIYAVTLATSYIQRASTMDYDQKTVGANEIATDATGSKLVAPTTTNLTADASLGRDAATVPAEVANNEDTFNDFDDFKGFAKNEVIPNVDTYITLADVYYISPGAPDVKVLVPTFFKRIDIRTYSTIGRGVFEERGADAASKGVDTIKLSYIFAYL